MDNAALNKALENIEREAEQDFNLLLATGPAFFSTAQLLELRGKLSERLVFFRRMHRLTLWVGATAPSWIPLGFLFGLLGWIPLAMIMFLFFPVHFTIFLGCVFLQKAWLGPGGELEQVALMVDMELARRSEDVHSRRK
jgi:hypothetical protein